MRSHPITSSPKHAPRGSALVLVLVVIMLLTFGAYTFSELMLTEYQAADASGRQMQALAAAQSGIEYVTTLLTVDGGGWDTDLYHNPAVFHVPVSTGGGFTIVAPIEGVPASIQNQAAGAGVLRMGLIDESSRINLNVLASFDPADGVARGMLLTLPNMTSEIADSILDWIDADTDIREFGAEEESYTVVFPRNGPLDTLEELLLVNGVTPQLFYGEDANRNGVLDANENDGELSLPADNQDDLLDAGWVEYLTLQSKESNLRHAGDLAGEPRINLNETLLTDLYDQLEEELGSEIALFVTAYRLNGPLNTSTGAAGSCSSTSTSSSSGSSSSSSSGSSSSGSGNSSGSSTSTTAGLSRSSTSGSGTTTTGNATTDTALLGMATALAGALSGASGAVTRGGMDLSAGGSTTINSVYDLIGVEVQATVNGQQTVLASPWGSDPGSLQQTLGELLDTVTITDETEILGRINVNQARLEVLQGIPNMPAGVAEEIVAARDQRITGGTSTGDRFATSGWILIEGLVDLPTMRLLDSSLTARGNVFRMQVLGHFDRGGPIARLEAVVDAAGLVPKILMQRNLAELGPGFHRGDLPAFETEIVVGK
jgi:type II secretory pathway component PulK